jgi:hypothetical protein
MPAERTPIPIWSDAVWATEYVWKFLVPTGTLWLQSLCCWFRSWSLLPTEPSRLLLKYIDRAIAAPSPEIVAEPTRLLPKRYRLSQRGSFPKDIGWTTRLFSEKYKRSKVPYVSGDTQWQWAAILVLIVCRKCDLVTSHWWRNKRSIYVTIWWQCTLRWCWQFYRLLRQTLVDARLRLEVSVLWNLPWMWSQHFTPKRRNISTAHMAARHRRLLSR